MLNDHLFPDNNKREPKAPGSRSGTRALNGNKSRKRVQWMSRDDWAELACEGDRVRPGQLWLYMNARHGDAFAGRSGRVEVRSRSKRPVSLGPAAKFGGNLIPWGR